MAAFVIHVRVMPAPAISDKQGLAFGRHQFVVETESPWFAVVSRGSIDERRSTVVETTGPVDPSFYLVVAEALPVVDVQGSTVASHHHCQRRAPHQCSMIDCLKDGSGVLHLENGVRQVLLAYHECSVPSAFSENEQKVIRIKVRFSRDTNNMTNTECSGSGLGPGPRSGVSPIFEDFGSGQRSLKIIPSTVRVQETTFFSGVRFGVP